MCTKLYPIAANRFAHIFFTLPQTRYPDSFYAGFIESIRCFPIDIDMEKFIRYNSSIERTFILYFEGDSNVYKTSKDTQKRKEAKRQLILDTAARVFAGKGYYNTTVKDIVDAAAVSVGSFYFYFKSKEDLFAELYRSIAEKFSDNTMGVLDVENLSLLKNFTRVMTANLWLYDQNRDIAKIMLLEAAIINPDFQMIMTDSMKESAQVMTAWFEKFKLHPEVNIPDSKIAALMYAGSYYYFINDWLESDIRVPLTDDSFAFCVYNLQALNIPFEEAEVKGYIDEVLEELKK
mgnify:FL=1